MHVSHVCSIYDIPRDYALIVAPFRDGGALIPSAPHVSEKALTALYIVLKKLHDISRYSHPVKLY